MSYLLQSISEFRQSFNDIYRTFILIVSSFLLYFSSCILMFILYKYAAKQYHSFVFNFWKVQEVMYLIKNILITYGILCFRKKKLISP